MKELGKYTYLSFTYKIRLKYTTVKIHFAKIKCHKKKVEISAQVICGTKPIYRPLDTKRVKLKSIEISRGYCLGTYL